MRLRAWLMAILQGPSEGQRSNAKDAQPVLRLIIHQDSTDSPHKPPFYSRQSHTSQAPCLSRVRETLLPSCWKTKCNLNNHLLGPGQRDHSSKEGFRVMPSGPENHPKVLSAAAKVTFKLKDQGFFWKAILKYMKIFLKVFGKLVEGCLKAFEQFMKHAFRYILDTFLDTPMLSEGLESVVFIPGKFKSLQKWPWVKTPIVACRSEATKAKTRPTPNPERKNAKGHQKENIENGKPIKRRN